MSTFYRFFCHCQFFFITSLLFPNVISSRISFGIIWNHVHVARIYWLKQFTKCRRNRQMNNTYSFYKVRTVKMKYSWIEDGPSAESSIVCIMKMHKLEKPSNKKTQIEEDEKIVRFTARHANMSISISMIRDDQKKRSSLKDWVCTL